MFYVEGTRKLQPQSGAVSKTTSVQVCVINPSFCTKNSIISRKTVGEKKKSKTQCWRALWSFRERIDTSSVELNRTFQPCNHRFVSVLSNIVQL